MRFLSAEGESRRWGVCLAVGLGVALLMASGAREQAAAAEPIAPPNGWLRLCEDAHPVCVGDYAAGSITKRDVEKVHRAVVGGIQAKPDHFGDVWSVWPYRGDCEDFALSAMASLLEKGWPRDALSLVIVRDAWSVKNHMVLVVEHGDERLVVDNLADEVYALEEMTHLALQWQIDGGSDWVRVR